MLIVITLPTMRHGEAREIAGLLRGGVDLVHIRKPQASREELEKLLLAIPQEWHSRLVLHDHYELAVKYRLHGVHLNSRHPLPPEGWTGSVSRSCHSIDEVKAWKERCDYVSLSPIFDSISKPGYQASFTTADLQQARKEGIIDRKVMALGGVTFSRMDDILRMGFGGGMILGDAWHEKRQPVALTIAGSDPSAGAGIQQDLKTMHALGVYGATIITALTSQNTLGVQQVMNVPAAVVASQLDSVLSDQHVCAVKIGMIPNGETAHSIATRLLDYRQLVPELKVVYDPVMVSTSGRRLMADDCLDTVVSELFPLCTLVTPNLAEADVLLQAYGDRAAGHASTSNTPRFSTSRLHSSPTTAEVCGTLSQKFGCSLLVKGGHGEGDTLTDSLFLPNGNRHDYTNQRIATTNLHGTGCTLSSAIASFLLQGDGLEQAVARAEAFVHQAIVKGEKARIGRGNGPLMV